jgi:hypothetical protein
MEDVMSRAIARACLIATLCLPMVYGSTNAQAPGPKGKRPPVQTIICPPVLVPAGVHPIIYRDAQSPDQILSQAVPGWNGYGIMLNKANWPRIEGGRIMSCYYMRDYAVFQVIGHRKCTVRPDHLGFDCVP